MNQMALDLTAARQARDRGVARTASANAQWMDSMLGWLRNFAEARETMTFEQFRVHCAVMKRPAPTTHHAWGALTLAAVREGLIEWTGRYVQATSKKTHAHPVKVWKSMVYRRAA